MSEMCNVCGKYKSWCDARHGAEVVRLRAALARAEAERDANEAERLRRVLALLLMLEATEAERDRLREERDGFRDTYHEQLTLRQQAEAERDAALKRESVLREALTTLIAATDPLDSIRRYDEIADAFERETGYWPPGRSRPLAMGGESPMREQEAREAWRAFCNRWHEAKTADARRALAAPADPALVVVRREVLVALLTWKGGADLQGALAFAYVHGVGHVSEVRAKEIDALWGSVAAAAKADGGGK